MWGDAAKTFIKKLLDPDPMKRPSAAEALMDPVRPFSPLLPFNPTLTVLPFVVMEMENSG